MATININLHYEKPNLSTDPLSSRSISIAIEEINMPSLPQGIQRYRYEKIFFYGFSQLVKEGSDVVLAHMLLPKYFEELRGQSQDLHGLFLVGFLPSTDQAKKIVGIMMDFMYHGPNGCPWLLNMPAISHNRFTFNNMSFHPFLMIDLTIGYYVCDQGGRYDWDETNTLEALAVDDPIVYDATLGLYVTRAALRYDPKDDPGYDSLKITEFNKLYSTLKSVKSNH